MDRVGIFIDGPNLYGGAKRLTGEGRLDMPAVVQWLASGREIAEVAYWNAQLRQEVDPTRYAGQQRFFAEVENRIPNARVGRAHLRPREGRWIEKRVDVGVALDLVLGAYEDLWDIGIVVTGDGDIARAGRLVRAMDKGFEVACCSGSLSGLLRKEADELRWMDAALLSGFAYARPPKN